MWNLQRFTPGIRLEIARDIIRQEDCIDNRACDKPISQCKRDTDKHSHSKLYWRYSPLSVAARHQSLKRLSEETDLVFIPINKITRIAEDAAIAFVHRAVTRQDWHIAYTPTY